MKVQEKFNYNDAFNFLIEAKKKICGKLSKKSWRRRRSSYLWPEKTNFEEKTSFRF